MLATSYGIRDRVELVEGPTGEVVTADEAAVYLGGLSLTDADAAALLDTLLEAAHDLIDGWDTEYGWCFRERTLRLTLPEEVVEFRDAFVLPGGPSAITGATLDGQASTEYETDIVDHETRVTLEDYGEWIFTYTVGSATVPPAAKLALLRLVGSFWSERRAQVDEAARMDLALMLRRHIVRTDWE